MRIDCRKDRMGRRSSLGVAFGFELAVVFALISLSQACAQPVASSAASETPVRRAIQSAKMAPPEALTQPGGSSAHRVRLIAGTTSGGMQLREFGPVSTSRLAYSNTLGQHVFSPAAGARIADDIITTGASTCMLDRYVFRVSGDNQGDLSGAGPYAVKYALYETCPGSSTAPVPIPGTTGFFEAPDNGVYDVEVVIPKSTSVVIPNALYLALTFSRENAGVFLAGPALVGFSADSFDFPGGSCTTTVGGFPAAPHSSFHVELYVRGTCVDTYPTYVNSNQGGRPFTPDGTRLVAEQISLSVSPNRCNMVGYTVGFRGQSLGSLGVVRTQLHTNLSDVDPEVSGLIPGTVRQSSIIGDDVQLVRAEFDTPILLTQQNYWMVIRTSSKQVGPIATCVSPALGGTQDVLAEFGEGGWSFPANVTGCGGGFEITIHCQGPPPTGACCDMIHTDNRTCIGGPFDGLSCVGDGDCACPLGLKNCQEGTCVGDSVCRERAQMNCAFPDLWQENSVCESTCDGGNRDGQPCTRQVDCPGGDCPGPFTFNGGKPCGTSACCTYDDSCLDITERECLFIEPVTDPREFERGQSCNLNGQRCSVGICLGSEGSCCTEEIVLCVGGTSDGQPCSGDVICDPVSCDVVCREGGGNCLVSRGCSDASCCTKVCTQVDFFCCETHWDELCVTAALELCETCREPCPEVDITWLDPPDGVVDARRPSGAGGSGRVLDSFVIEARLGGVPVTQIPADCFSLCESPASLSANFVERVVSGESGSATWTVDLARPITPGAVTKIIYTSDGGVVSAGTFTSHPANVSGGAVADVGDVVALVQVLRGTVVPEWGIYSVDCDRSGEVTPADMLCVIDLLTGGGTSDPGWDQTLRPNGCDGG